MAFKCPDGIQQKLIRAEMHLTEVARALNSFTNGECHLIPEINEELKLMVLRIDITPKITSQLSAMVGDFLFNARCILDYLVWAIILQAGNTPTAKNMFPITSSGENFASQLKRKRLDGVPVEAVAIIKGLQPCSARNHPLAWLDSLHNVDKHRELIMTTVVADNTSLDFDGSLSMFLGDEELYDKAIFGDVGIPLDALGSEMDRFTNVEVKGEATLFVAFKELSPEAEDLRRVEVLLVLESILSFIKYDTLERLIDFATQSL
jgi:hypothetical protein